MPGSYELINYALRPAKCIERKMLCEASRKLSEFAHLDSFRYIGFGSTYFSDFALFHRLLGIRNMVSIERDVANRERFSFNLPYRCIDLEFGDSNDVLPNLGWNSRTITWLDYDDKLSSSVLADVKLVCVSTPPVSMLIVTVNARPDEFEGNTARLPQLIQRVGEDKVPNGILERDLASWGSAAVARRIINNEIHAALRERNGTLPQPNQIEYRQLFNFRYADGAKMLTVGGLLYERAQQPNVEKCDFRSLDFVRLGASPCLIEVPNLTYKEIRHLNSQLPRTKRKRLTSPKVPSRDIKRYAATYRHFPHFAEMEF